MGAGVGAVATHRTVLLLAPARRFFGMLVGALWHVPARVAKQSSMGRGSAAIKLTVGAGQRRFLFSSSRCCCALPRERGRRLRSPPAL